MKFIHKFKSILILGVFLINVCAVIPVHAAADYAYKTSFGTAGSGDGQFSNPLGIAIDSSGNKYVVDQGNNRVQKFDSSGNYQLQFGSAGSGDGQFDGPTGIAIEPSSGNVWVVDSGNNRVQAFDASGTFISIYGTVGSGVAEFGEFSHPQGIAFDSSGNRYVVDTDNHRVQVFNSANVNQLQFGSSGSGDGQFTYPTGIAIDGSGNIYVADYGNNRVQKFDSSGSYVSQFAVSQPWFIKIDSADNVYVTEVEYGRVQKYSSDGTNLTTITNPALSYVYGVDVDAQGHIFVTSAYMNTAIIEFELGPYLTQWSSGVSSPQGIAYDYAGDSIYVLNADDSSGGMISKYSTDGSHLVSFVTKGTNDDQIDIPKGIVVDSSGYIYVLNFNSSASNYRVKKFDSNGVYQTQWGSEGSGDGGFNFPVAIAIDGRDILYISDTGRNDIQKFTTGGVFLDSFTTSGQYGLTINKQGQIYVHSNSYTVYKYEQDGTPTDGGFGTSGSTLGYFSGLRGMSVDSEGNLYVLEEDNHRVQKIDSTNAGVLEFGSSGTGNGEFGYVDGIGPRGIVQDSLGFIYVADTSNNRIQKFRSTVTSLPLVSATADPSYVYLHFAEDIDPISLQLITSEFEVRVDNNYPAIVSSDLTDANTIRLTLDGSPISYGDEVTISFNGGMTVIESNESDKAFVSINNVIVRNTIELITISQLGYSINQNQTEATLSWSTNYNSNAVINYGIGSVGENSVSVSNESTTGTVTITGLNPNTVYKYQITVTQVGGSNTAQSAEKTFTTNYLGTFAIDFYTRGVAVNSTGDIYVVNGDSNRVVKLNQYGDQLSQFGSSGSSDGQFSSPEGVAIGSADSIYVVDTGNNRVQKFDSSGVYVSQFGTSGSSDGQFSSPKGIAIDDAGNIYVADTGNSRIQKFDSSGTYVSQFGTYDSYGGQLNNPHSITQSINGDMLLTSTGIHGILRFGSDTTPPTVRSAQINSDILEILFDEPLMDNSFTIDRTDFLVFINGILQTVESMSISGSKVSLALSVPVVFGDIVTLTYIPSVTNIVDVRGNGVVMDIISNLAVDNITLNVYHLATIGSAGSSDGQFSSPEGVAIGSADSIYVVDTGNNRVQKFDSSGTYLSQFGSAGSGDGQFSSPKGIAIDDAGNIYVADTGNSRIQKFDSSGTYLSQISGDFSDIKNIKIHNSTIFAIDSGVHRIRKYDVSNNFLSEIGYEGSDPGKFNTPSAVAFDSNYNMYVVDSGNNRIQKFDNIGSGEVAYGSEWGRLGSEDGQFNSPRDIFIDSSDNIYVVDSGNNRIQKFNTDGVYKGKWVYTTSGDTQMQGVHNITMDNRGNVYLSNGVEDNVQKVSFNTIIDIVPPVISNIATSTATTTVRITWNTNEHSSSTVRYGLTTSYTHASSSSALTTTPSITLTGLTSGATYHFSILSSDVNGNATSSTDAVFTMPDSIAPVISNIATSTATTTATITWNTNEHASSTVRYGLTTVYGSTTATSTATTSHSVNISALVPSTVYHYQILAIDRSGNIATTTDRTFMTSATPDTTAPTFSSIASSTTQTTATITWTTNEVATSTVNHGLTSSYGTASSSAVATTSHRIVLTDLTADTTYHFRISSWDAVSNLATSSDLTFTTLDATTSSPTLLSPTAGTYTNTSPMPVTFTLPESPLTNSIRLTFTPSTGSPIVLQLRDVSSGVTNTFNLPLANGIAAVTEVLSTTADSIPVDTYTVSLTYQDVYGNSPSSATVTDVVVQAPTTPRSSSSGGDGSGSTTGGYISYPSIVSVVATSTATSTFATSTATSTATTTIVFKFTRDLILHNIHPEVLRLQKFLNAKGYIVAKTGPGSTGKETTKFGSATKAALIKFQRANKIPGTGFFGPVTRAFVNKMK